MRLEDLWPLASLALIGATKLVRRLGADALIERFASILPGDDARQVRALRAWIPLSLVVATVAAATLLPVGVDVADTIVTALLTLVGAMAGHDIASALAVTVRTGRAQYARARARVTLDEPRGDGLSPAEERLADSGVAGYESDDTADRTPDRRDYEANGVSLVSAYLAGSRYETHSKRWGREYGQAWRNAAAIGGDVDLVDFVEERIEALERFEATRLASEQDA